MHGRHHPYQEIEPHALALVHPGRDGLSADSGHAKLAVRLVDETVMKVVRQLAVDADRPDPVQDGVARSLEHGQSARATRTRVTSILVVGVSPSRGALSIFATTSKPSTTRPNAVY